MGWRDRREGVGNEKWVSPPRVPATGSFIEVAFSTKLSLCGLFSSWGKQGLLSSCGEQAWHWGSFFRCRAQSLWCVGFSSCGTRPQQMWCMSSAAPMHVGPSQIRDRTCVSCIGRQTLHHWATMEALWYFYNDWKLSHNKHSTFIKGLLCPRYFKYLICMLFLSPHHTPVRQAVWRCPFYRWKEQS